MAPKKKKAEPGPADKGCDFIRANEVDNLVALLEGLSVKQMNKHEIKGGKNMLHVAVDEENYVMVSILVDYGLKVNFRTKDMKTALMIAVSKGLDDIYNFLIQAGADVCIPDADGNTVLHIACHKGNLTMIKAITDELKNIVKGQEEEEARRLKKEQEGSNDEDEEEEEAPGAVEDPTLQASSGASAEASALDAASAAKPEGSTTEGAPAEEKKEGETAEGAAVTGEGEEEEEEEEGDEEKDDKKKVKRETITFIGEIDRFNDAKETPLAVAIKMGHFEIAALLVSFDANPNSRCMNDNTPLTRSAFDGRIETNKWLTNYCKTPVDIHARNFNGESAIIIAIKQRNYSIAKNLLAAGASIEDKDGMGNTALIFGAMAVNMDTVKFCVESCQANVDASNNWGMTPLMYAARAKKGGLILDYLLGETCNADLNMVDKSFNNALMHACKAGNITSATKMLQIGGDWLQKDVHGKIAKELVKPYSKDPERNQKMFEDALRANMSVDTVDSKYPLRQRPGWVDRQVQEEADEAFRIAEDKYITQVLEEEAEMLKQEELERAKYQAELSRIAEEQRREKEAFEALPEEEKRKILKKQAKEKALRKAKAMEDFEKNGVPLPEEFAMEITKAKPSSKKKPSSPKNKSKK